MGGKGIIGGWNIQDGGLYNSVSGTGFIKLEVNGGRQLSINSSADPPVLTKGLQAKTIDAMNATIQNITVTNATISGTLNGCTGIFSGNLIGVKGTIGGWNIQDGGLYNSVSGTGFIKLEVNGGRYLKINDSADSPVLAIRSDSKPALSIYTQDNGVQV